MPVIVSDIRELLDVGGDLRLQRRRQHLPRTVADQLIQQRHRFLLLLRSLLTNYREHRRTFPTSVDALALLGDLYRDYLEGTSSQRCRPTKRSRRPIHRFQALLRLVGGDHSVPLEPGAGGPVTAEHLGHGARVLLQGGPPGGFPMTARDGP